MNVIVDDSKFTCIRIHDLLKNIDPSCEVVSFQDLDEASQFLNANHSNLDLLFVDYNMPQMNGLEFVEKVKNVVSINSIVLTTANAAFSTGGIEVPEGMEFIQKPCNEEMLRSLLEKKGLLEKRAS